jgi:hypothetical protein
MPSVRWVIKNRVYVAMAGRVIVGCVVWSPKLGLVQWAFTKEPITTDAVDPDGENPRIGILKPDDPNDYHQCDEAINKAKELVEDHFEFWMCNHGQLPREIKRVGRPRKQQVKPKTAERFIIQALQQGKDPDPAYVEIYEKAYHKDVWHLMLEHRTRLPNRMLRYWQRKQAEKKGD